MVHSLDLDHSKTEHSLIELIPSGQLRDSLFILHIYSSPRDMRQRFTSLISKAVRKAAGSPLVVAGDFNAPHQEWGYHRVTAKGANLWRAASDYGLTLVTDPSFPTRIGNSCTRDTTPDLTFVANVGATAWCNLNESLGSDHCVLATSLVVRKRSPKKFTITDWDLFRKIREEREVETPTSLDSWVAQLKEDVESGTKSIATDLNVDRMDSRLAHLLEAKGALLARWKGQRLNRRLRVKVRFPGKQTKYKGPFTIRSQVGPNSFRLSDGNVWNASKLVPVSAEPNTPAPRNSSPTLPNPSSDIEQPLMQPKLIRLPMWH